MRRRSTGLFAVSTLTLTLLAGLPGTAAEATPQNPRKGHGQHGLVSAKGKHVAHCADHMFVTGSGICVHGSDDARAGVDVTQPRSVAELRQAAYEGAPPTTTPQSVPGVAVPPTDGSGVVVCEGDGVSGKRVQVLYVRTADVASRFASLRDALEQNVLFADWQFNASAAQTGGARHLRFVTKSDGQGGCILDLKEVVLPAPVSPAEFDFDYSIAKLRAAGYTSTSRKYLMLTDADYLCGIGTMYMDDTAGASNASNWYAAEYSRVDTSCWHYAEAHELMHNMGGVQDSAPHSSLAGHCHDEYDVMCYEDGGPDGISGNADDPVMTYPCAYEQEDLFDCGKDDYFNTSPVAGSYLTTKWNAATSAYLIQPNVAASNTVQVTAPADQSSTFGTPVSPVQVTATDATPGQTLTYAAAGLPDGLTIDPATGVISGTPTEGGLSTVVLTAADGANAAGSATFSWDVAPVAPSAPTGVTVTAGRKQLGISWSAPVDGGSPITSYDVTITPSGGAPTTTTTSGSPYTATGLANDTTYGVTVAARNTVGTGTASAPVAGTPSAVVPGAPTGVTATASDGAASVAFSAPPDDGDLPVTNYTATASTGEQVSGSGSPLSFTGLSNSVTRTFTVTATNAKGTSASSGASNPVAFWNSTLTIGPAASTVVAGTAVTLKGTLSSGPASSRPLVLVTYPAGQPTRTSTLTTAATGTWSVKVTPTYTSTYRVTYAGDATHHAVTSALVKVTVKTRITITSPSNGVRTSTRTVKVTGRTTPNKSGVAVRLYEVRKDGSLAYLSTATVGRYGNFALVKTLTRGTHRLVVTIPATPKNAPGRSAVLTVYEV